MLDSNYSDNSCIFSYSKDIYKVQRGIPETFISAGYQSGSGFKYYPQAMVDKVSDDIDTNYFVDIVLSTQAVKIIDNIYIKSVMSVRC